MLVSVCGASGMKHLQTVNLNELLVFRGADCCELAVLCNSLLNLCETGQGDGLPQRLLLDRILNRRRTEQRSPEGPACSGGSEGKTVPYGVGVKEAWTPSLERSCCSHFQLLIFTAFSVRSPRVPCTFSVCSLCFPSMFPVRSSCVLHAFSCSLLSAPGSEEQTSICRTEAQQRRRLWLKLVLPCGGDRRDVRLLSDPDSLRLFVFGCFMSETLAYTSGPRLLCTYLLSSVSVNLGLSLTVIVLVFCPVMKSLFITSYTLINTASKFQLVSLWKLPWKDFSQ